MYEILMKQSVEIKFKCAEVTNETIDPHVILSVYETLIKKSIWNVILKVCEILMKQAIEMWFKSALDTNKPID